MEERKVLAADLGASGGRVMAAVFDGEKIEINVLHRFSNDPVTVNGTMYWDVLRLFFEIKQGLVKSKVQGRFESIAVDTWGVDFGLLDNDGRLLENPVHYRDGRTAGMAEKSFQYLDREKFYRCTGNQFMDINTAFQLLSLKEQREGLLDRADGLLLMPDLFHFFLCRERKTDWSIASTTQLFDPVRKDWSHYVLDGLDIRSGLLPEAVPCGTVIGMLSEQICEELGVGPMKVTAAAGHDTQCAMAAVPADCEDFIFISCGTWSLLGTELSAPVINETSMALNMTNELGVGGRVSFLKNIIGLWLVQESRRQWQREGKDYSFSVLEKNAGEQEPFRCFIDPDDPVFTPAGDVPGRIRSYCMRTGQETPETEGQTVRCIDESLALKYRRCVKEIELCCGKKYDTIYMVGGGAQSALLCQMTADACNKRVLAGPVEATVLGNAGIQLMALGAIKDVAQVRETVRRSADIREFTPGNTGAWDEAAERFERLL